MYKELVEIRNRIDNLIGSCKSETRFEKVGELYGEKGKYALYLAPKETEKVLTWNEAMEYCKSLDGELPTMSELQYLYENCKEKFQSTSYWSSSQLSAATSWPMSFSNGSRLSALKTFTSRVRVVRRISL